MSSTAVMWQGLVSREREACVDEDLLRLEEEARRLLSGGPVCFKKSSRVPAARLPWWKRRHYTYFCREAPERLRVPPLPAQQLDVWTSFALAVADCASPDDQLLAMPLNRTARADVLSVAVECRPRDPEDADRFRVLSAVFGDYETGDAHLETLTPAARILRYQADTLTRLAMFERRFDRKLTDLDERLRALEERDGNARAATPPA